jgi:Cu+-exporting ATPase
MSTQATQTTERLELPLEGMTCSSCANRIERKLNKLDGVQATVNYATEKAAVQFDPAEVSTDDLAGAVEAAGYKVRLPQPAGAGADGAEGATDVEDRHVRELRTRLIGAAVLSVPLLFISMIPAAWFAPTAGGAFRDLRSSDRP